MTDRVLAIDGGNSKTAVLLVDADGKVLAQVRGPGAPPQTVGMKRGLDVFESLAREAAAQAGLSPDEPIATHTAAYLAGADLPREEEDLTRAISERGWSPSVVVGNDTFALLRSGTASGVGVAVVCGAGINAVGVAADGRTHRFPALGPISGDWGGGGHLGEQALWLAVRAEDGRGKPTELLPALLEHYGETSIADVVEKLHFEEVKFDPHALCPILFEVAGHGDPVARSIVDRLIEEIVLLSTVSLRKLDLVDEAVDVVLGGGVMTGTGETVLAPVRRQILDVAPLAQVRVVDLPPVVGAALLGLDTIGASPGAELRLRSAYDDHLPATTSTLDVAASG
ncbi:N-acetylglucosamine kinase-like BadF-type ATPase [Lentzea atacamensis]|uniref:N-acetylglucosamine kinase-like BadF-type ATPase n=1 Tax=Lentzea atacamensis TaxID=531938 RepID=A0ABX9DZI5_9PSEU|nr:BadF/BadG/BcrA/BcrD ATPase family protein [Lentzea atacamensis]RAS60175.1 N-acetylglucosamine kinase-like BadF-type ATPase [Lentzea atacamensis]